MKSLTSKSIRNAYFNLERLSRALFTPSPAGNFDCGMTLIQTPNFSCTNLKALIIISYYFASSLTKMGIFLLFYLVRCLNQFRPSKLIGLNSNYVRLMKSSASEPSLSLKITPRYTGHSFCSTNLV